MAAEFPTSDHTKTTTAASDPRNSPSLSGLINDIQDELIATQQKVGTDGDATTSTHDYKLSGVTGSDKAVSKTGTETLTNKTLTSPVINVGSDAQGDIYQRDGSGNFTRLGIGTASQILQVNAGATAAEWATNTGTTDATTTAKGVSERATASEINAGTATGGSGTLFVGPAELLTSNYVQSSEVSTLIDGEAVTKVNVTTTNATVSSTGTETTFYTVSIPGGTLGTNDGIKGQFRVTISSSSTTNKTINMKYGSTTLTAAAFAKSGTSASTINGLIDFYLLGAGSTAAQEATLTLHSNDYVERSSDQNQINIGTATEDSTGALNLVFTITQNSVDSFTMNNAYVTTIK